MQAPRVRSRLDPAIAITAREADLLRLLASGLHVTEMARQLGLAPATVHQYLQRLKALLGARALAQLAALAVEHGLTPPPANDTPR